MKSFSNYLFLLIANLSQHRDHKQIIEMFIDGLNSLLADKTFYWSEDESSDNAVAVSTRKNNFGYVVCNSNFSEWEQERYAIFQNGVQMVAIILERLLQERLLSKKKDSLEKLVEERTQELRDQNHEYASLNEEYRAQNEELLKAIKKAEESEERFTLAMRASNDGLFDWNLETDEIYFSPGWKKMLGYEEHELPNELSTWENRTDPQDVNKSWELQQKLIRKQIDRFVTESKMKHKDGRWVDILVRGEVYFNNNEKALRMVGTHTDITARKKAEKELVIAKERAEESDRLKSAFLANMSHEIRTPMNGILGFADLLKNPELEGDKHQKYLEIIEKSGKRMLAIIKDIVDISKIEAGLMEFNLSDTNVNEQIEYSYTFFKREAEAKGIALSYKTELSADEAVISTDPEKLSAILSNLVKNAIKYTKAGSIEVGYHLKAGKAQDNLEFYISDTGVGIPKDRQKAIFERFIQDEIEDKIANQGVGLGLAITKNYVEKLGGKIWLESAEEKGSTFYFTLPYKNDPVFKKKEIEPATHENDIAIKKMKILIAEDDEVSEMLLNEAIESYSEVNLKANTGIEAVETCRNNPDIDLILMDIRMPEMNGYEATRQIRKFNKDVVILAQTAHGLAGDLEKSLEAGCNDYISKPISTKELYALIHKYFGNSSGEVQHKG